MRVSYSSSQTYLGCQRKFYYEKVRGYDPDPDHDENTLALRMGTCFHDVLEAAAHSRSRLKNRYFLQAFKDNEIYDETNQGYIYAMVARYLKMHEKSGLTSIAHEVEIIDDDFRGFVDSVMVDSYHNWWIVDLKTAKQLQASLLPRLSKDQQLNIYAFYSEEVAKIVGIDPDLFAGVRYRVTTKPGIKKNKKENFLEFKKRCFERCESFDIGISKDDLSPEQTYLAFMRLLDQMRELEVMEEDAVPQNFGYCESYFKPCPFWSRCYGKLFSAQRNKLIMYDSSTMVDLSMDDLEGI